jgi:hypothetical protein
MSTPSSSTDTNEPETTPTRVCQFLVKSIRCGSKHGPKDLKVELFPSHSLMDLVELVFTKLRDFKLTTDRFSSHLWNLRFNGKNYSNGWRGCRAAQDVFRGMKHIDEQEPRFLDKLDLKVAQKGSFSGESAYFEFVVEEVIEIALDQQENYPKVTEILCNFSSVLDSSFLKAEDKQEALKLRQAWQKFMKGENAWKKDRDTRQFIRAKPQAPEWKSEENAIMNLLIQSGSKFKKSWTNLLQYALVDRAESATSGMWYKLAKCQGYTSTGNVPSDAKVIMAKRLTLNRLENFLEAGTPKAVENPMVSTEKVLLKRGILKGTESPESKRMKCSHWYHELREEALDYE